jgi:hypothetical protein
MKPFRSALLLSLVGLMLVGPRLHAEEPGPTPPQASPPQARPDSLPLPDYLSEEARRMLRQKMGRHGDDMVELMLSVTLLQYDVASEVSHRIANEPRIDRPSAGAEDDVGAALPERFFKLQDELRVKAQAVRAAAVKRDDKELAKSYGRLTETCVSCHSAYLRRR